MKILLALQMAAQLAATIQRINETVGRAVGEDRDMTEGELAALSAETDHAFEQTFGKPDAL